MWKCCNVKLNFTVGKEVMKGMERLLLLYINSEHTEREITTSYRDMLKELAFLKHTHTCTKTRLVRLGNEKLESDTACCDTKIRL